MKISNLFALVLLLAAVLFGVMADVLMRDARLGVNLPLLVAAFLGIAFVVSRRSPIPLTGGGRWLAVPVLLLAAVFAVRDAGLLLFSCVLLGLGLMGAGMMRARHGQIRVTGIVSLAVDAIIAGVMLAIGGFWVMLFNRPWQGENLRGSRAVSRVALGVVMSIPLLMVFGALFASADATFGRMVRDFFRLDTFFQHLPAILIWAWLGAGALHTIFSADPLIEGSFKPAGGAHFVETATVLGLMNILFAVFVALQFPYFFSLTPIGATPGLDPYADYARRGFFELVAVAVLLLPVLLMADWMTESDTPAHRRIAHLLSLILAAQMGVIMVSAFQRMALYTRQFGLTEMRFYTTAFMIGLGLLFIWLALTVLRNRRQKFAFGALACAVAVILALAAINPDYQIARYNLAQSGVVVPGSGADASTGETRRAVDTAYIATLSADAVPAILEALPKLEETQRCALTSRLMAQWVNAAPRSDDWRSFNLSRASALAMTREWTPYLRSVFEGCPAKPSR